MRGEHPKIDFYKSQLKLKKKMEYIKIKQLVLSKGFEFFEDGNYNLNCIWERTSDKFTNYFTDKFHILYKVDGVEHIVSIPATTKAGMYGKGTVTQPNTVEGITGVAIIIPGQYKSTWQFTMGNGSGKLPFGYPYFQQIKGISYWRDGNKDDVVNRVNEQDNKLFGTNWHIMQEPINNWSMGCMGISMNDMMNVVVPLVTKSTPIWGNVFTGTVILTNN